MLFAQALARISRPGSSHKKPWSLLGHFTPMVIAAVIGVTLSAATGFFMSQWENRHAVREFNAIAENHYLVLQNGIDEYLNKLVTLRALFDSSDDPISRNEFESFARSFLRSGSAIQTLSWVPRVRRGERVTYERLALRDGIAGFHFKAAAADGVVAGAETEHDEYYPIFYATVPKASKLYGLDLRTEPLTLIELERARDENELGFSTRPVLVSAEGRQHGHIFFPSGLPQGAAARRLGRPSPQSGRLRPWFLHDGKIDRYDPRCDDGATRHGYAVLRSGRRAERSASAHARFAAAQYADRTEVAGRDRKRAKLFAPADGRKNAFDDCGGACPAGRGRWCRATTAHGRC